MLGAMISADLTKGHVSDLHDVIFTRAPVVANRVIQLLRRIMRAAANNEKIVMLGDPFSHLKDHVLAPEHSRERSLNEDEIKYIWEDMEAESENQQDILRLILLTGQRLGEVSGMAVDEVDPGRMLWTIPKDRIKTKKKRPYDHEVPLSPQAWAILKPRLKNDKWIFPSGYNRTRIGAKGDGHTKCVKESRYRIIKHTGIEPWTAVDLRRTARTWMTKTIYKKGPDGEALLNNEGRLIVESKGAYAFIAEKILNDSVGKIEGTYDVAEYREEKRDVLILLANRIDKFLADCSQFRVRPSR